MSMSLNQRWPRSRRAPVDWRSERAPSPPASLPGPVDVVLPVHGAPEELERCLAALLRHTDLRVNGLIVVDDAGADSDVDRQLEELERLEGLSIEVVRHSLRRGFAGSVNTGMRHSRRDVILLNSDTEVTARWIEKLRAAAYSSPAIATATPFSNDATICSLPQPLEHNEIPAGHTIDSFAACIEEASAREYPRIPTGVGMSLFIKRSVLTDLGLFDEAAFAMGYGEENEFCLRALLHGYVHVLDDATFVYHVGQRSFREAGRALRRKAGRRLRRLHPEYYPMIARFLAEDPLRSARERVLRRLQPTPRVSPRADPVRRVLHLVHGWPPWNRAGTELYAQWLATAQAASHEVSAYSRIGDPSAEEGTVREYLDGGVRVRLVVNNFTQRNPLVRNSLWNPRLEQDFGRLLDETRPHLLHVHHLLGHAASLLGVAHRRGIPILYQAQDWWPACARVNFTHVSGTRCTGPGLAKCSRCFPLTGLPPNDLNNRALHLLRRSWLRRQLRLPIAFVMGSHFIERTYRELGLLPGGAPVFVRPYGVPLGDISRRRSPPPGSQRSEHPLRFGYVGSVLPHKGVHTAVVAFRDIPPALAQLDIWGDAAALPEYSESLRDLAGRGAVAFRGTFREADKSTILRDLDALIVPSIGYESFGLVAREAIAVGTPVLAARGSALSEMLEAGGSAGFEHDDPVDLRRIVLEVVAHPEMLGRWATAAPEIKGFSAHAEEIDEIYREVVPFTRLPPSVEP